MHHLYYANFNDFLAAKSLNINLILEFIKFKIEICDLKTKTV